MGGGRIDKGRWFWPMLVTAVVVGGMALRVWRLGDRSMWFDESVSWTTITRFSWGEMIQRAAQAVHPPLYYSCLRLWADCFGASLEALRLFSVVLAAVTMVGLYLFCRDAWGWGQERGAGSTEHGAGSGERGGRSVAASGTEGRWIGLLAAALAGASSYHILWSQQARMYTLGTALVALSSWLLVRALRNHRLGWWLAYGVTAAALMYTHNYGLFSTAAQGYFVVCYLAWESGAMPAGRLRRLWLKAAVGLATAVVLYLPWVPVLATQAERVAEGYWIRPLTGWTVPNAWLQLFWPRVAAGQPSRIAVVVVSLMVVGVLALSALKNRVAGWLVLAMAMVPVLCATAVSLAWAPIVVPRYFVFAQVFVFCAVAAAVWRVGRGRLRAVAAVGLVAASLGVHWRTVGGLDVAGHPGLRAAVDYVLSRRGTDEPLVVVHPAIFHAVRYYGRGAAEVRLFAPGALSHYTGAPLLVPGDRINAGELERLPAGRLWVVDTTGFSRVFPRFRLPADWAPVAGTEASFDEVYDYQGRILVSQYVRVGRGAGSGRDRWEESGDK